MRFKSSRRCKRTQTDTHRYGRWLLPSHASTITDTEMPLEIQQTAAGGWVGGCGGGITRTSCSRNALTAVKESLRLFEKSDFEWWLKKSMHATESKGATMRIKVCAGLAPLSPPPTPTPTPPILILLHYYDYCCCCCCYSRSSTEYVVVVGGGSSSRGRGDGAWCC